MKILLFLTFLSLFTVNTFSAVRTWNGGGSDSNWQTAENWVGVVAPVSGDDLVFPATAGQFSTNNNFIAAGTTFRSITFEGASYTVSGNSVELSNGLIVNGGSHTLNSVGIRSSQTFSAAQGSTVTIISFLSFGGLTNSYVLTLNGSGNFGFGVVFGIFNVQKNGSGASLISAGANYTGVLTLSDGLLIVDANIPNSIVNVNGGSVGGNLGFSGFGGTGSVGRVNVNTGIISAGTLSSPTGILNVRNSLLFNPGGNYVCKIGGTAPGANGHDQLNVTGDVFLNNARLGPLPWNGFRPAVGDTFVVVRNDGTDAVFGTFLNAPEGAVFAGPLNTAFRITYAGGDGNDIAVTRVARAPFDFDGDGKTDVSAFAGNSWHVAPSGSGTAVTTTQFGLPEDLLAPADFDGDNRTDIAVFRPANGAWYVLNSFTSTVSIAQFGTAGDLAVPNDFDGDGRADIAVFRPSTGVWYQLRSLGNQLFIEAFGTNGDKPQIADFDGDGIGDLAVFRPSNGAWYFLLSGDGSFVAFPWGISTDVPVPADYDGDGRTDAAVFRAAAAGDQPDFYILRSANFSAEYGFWGLPGDLPVIGDYDGDGRADLAVVRPNAGASLPDDWYMLRSTAGFAARQFVRSSRPVPGAYVR